MNKQDRHAAAGKMLDEIQERLHVIFDEYEKEAKGMSTEHANEVWRNYLPAYNINVRKLEAAGNMYFYTSDDVALITKQANHRHAVARMRAAGLHRMNTVNKY